MEGQRVKQRVTLRGAPKKKRLLPGLKASADTKFLNARGYERSGVKCFFLLRNLLILNVFIVGHQPVNESVRRNFDDPVRHRLGEFMIV